MKLNVVLALVLSLNMATDYHYLLGHHEFDLEDFLRGFFQGAFDYYGMTNTAHCEEYSGNFGRLHTGGHVPGVWVSV